MSARERAHPWWAEPLPAYVGRDGDDTISFRIVVEPRCRNCSGTVYAHHAYRVDSWYSPFYCASNNYATEWVSMRMDVDEDRYLDAEDWA